MLNANVISPVIRAILVMGAVAALVTGVTFATLQSQATLTDSTISSATAGLQVKSTGPDFAAQDAGFKFEDLIPGGAFSPSNDGKFTLKNSGSIPLSVQVQAETVAATGTGTLDKTKVIVRFTNLDAPGSFVDYTLAELESAARNVPGQSAGFTPTALANNDNDKMTIQVKLENGAITGSGPVSVSNFDLTFTGTSL